MIRLRLSDGSRRQLRVEEAAVLQGFPASYALPFPRRSAMRMIGNALPPPLALHIARQLRMDMPP